MLRPGDRVRLVSAAYTPDRQRVERGERLLSGWGLVVERGATKCFGGEPLGAGVSAVVWRCPPFDASGCHVQL
jgi:hypothetical protein